MPAGVSSGRLDFNPATSGRMKAFFLKSMLLIAALAIPAAVAIGAAWWYANRPLELVEPTVEFTVQRGSNMRQAAREIAAAGVDVHPEALYWIARLDGKAERIVAGSYEIGPGLSAREIIDKIHRGEVVRAEVLIVEGWNFRQLRRAVESHPYLRADTVDLSDEEILVRIGASESHPEGLFFPDTYLLDRHTSALEVFRVSYQAMQRRLELAWAQRDPSTPLRSPYEALIMASIIEKETGLADDRPLVSSVFANRLRIGMRLQTDPTVIYGFGEEFEGRLRRRHLETDHEYNTYTRAGLPPTPIAMPGWDSLIAAVQPAESQYFYFVARGDGSSQFSRNLADHNRAVNRFIRGRGG